MLAAAHSTFQFLQGWVVFVPVCDTHENRTARTPQLKWNALASEHGLCNRVLSAHRFFVTHNIWWYGICHRPVDLNPWTARTPSANVVRSGFPRAVEAMLACDVAVKGRIHFPSSLGSLSLSLAGH